jgi:hypothetical protein
MAATYEIIATTTLGSTRRQQLLFLVLVLPPIQI